MQMQQVTLVLRGKPADISDVIQLALAGGLLHSMTQDPAAPSTYNGAAARRHTVHRSWAVNQPVEVVKQDKGRYPNLPPIGTTGIVATVHSSGLKSGVTVRFGKDTPGGARSVRVAGRMLKAVSK